MKLSYVTGTRILGVVLLGGLWAAGCSSSSTPATTTAGTGGSTSTAATGGRTSTSTSTTATGGNTSAPATGGSTATSATGGASAAGGSSSTAVTCGTTRSTYSETTTFATTLGTWKLNTSPDANATLAVTTTSPTSNAALCTAGCAAFAYSFPATATAYGASNQMIEAFTTPQDLLGATITFTLAVDNPSAVPIQIQLFAGGGSVGGYGWSNITTITGTGLTAYAAATGFSTATVVVADNSSATQQFCSSDAHSIGIQLQNTTAPTAAGTVTVYVQKAVITPAA